MTKKEYRDIHQWLRATYGRPQICEQEQCSGLSKTYDWALKSGMSHKKDKNNYLRLCRKCHGKYDVTDEKKRRLLEIAHTPQAEASRSASLKGMEKSEITKNKMRETKRRNNANLCVGDKCMSLTEWAEKYHIKIGTLYARIRYYGFTLEDALKHKNHDRRN